LFQASALAPIEWFLTMDGKDIGHRIHCKFMLQNFLKYQI